MGFFGMLKRSPSQPIGNPEFQSQTGLKMVWVRKELPSPGAMNYAYETLALAPQSEISGAVAQRKQYALFAGYQVYKYQDAALQGIGTVSGQVISQPLYDPNSGYTNLPYVQNNSDLISANIVANRNGPRATNSPFLTNT